MKLVTLKHIIILAVVMTVSITIYAVPAKRAWRAITLTDGTQVEAMLIGDEHGHWYIDHEGKALAKNTDGNAYYLDDAQLSTLKQHRLERVARSNARRVANIEKTRALAAKATSSASSGPRKVFGQPTTIVGKKKGIVILVNYSDKKFQSTNNQALFNRRFNEVGYNANGYVGSVHDYFYDQSYGKFDLDFDVVGPVTVSHTHDYYGANDDDGDDKYAATMVIEAVKLADAQGVDFSQYDWDNDGYVDQVFVIYAGTGEAASYKENDIWPHEYELDAANYYGDGSGIQTIDGVKINTYAVSCELANSSTIDGIGTACHEFSHCLGYADLYDIDYSGGQGMSYWDLLDMGSYNGPHDNGEVPAAYTSFERWWAGWLDLTVLDTPQAVTNMPALNDTAVAYKIVNDAHPNEYYLLENRQAKKWDSYTASSGTGSGHGLMILHVDYDANVWAENGPNDEPNHQRMTYFPADNSYGTKSTSGDQSYWYSSYGELQGDPFPGTSGSTSFTDDTKPAATLYNLNKSGQKFMGKPITYITETDGLISFRFMETLDVTSAYTTSPTSFTASWSDMDNVKSYTVRAIPVVTKGFEDALILSESFTKCTGKGFTNVENSLDNYLDNKGWTGYKLYPYTVNNGPSLKVGNSSSGYLVTPTLSSESGYLTVSVSSMNYGTDTNKMTAYLCDTNGKQQSGIKEFTTGKSEFTTTVFSFEPSIDPCKIMFSPSKRAYINQVKIYDGDFSADVVNAASSKASASLKAMVRTSGDTIIVSGITDSRYTFTDLTADKYKFQVQAVFNDGTTSAWTSPITISLDATAISDVTVDAQAANSRIYNISGQFVGTDFQSLPKGIYIIDGRKVIKR